MSAIGFKRANGPTGNGPACRCRIGILKDSAFQFYYPENIEALEAAGAELLFISPLHDGRLPEIDALYVGGGFPETHAQELAENTEFSGRLRSLVDDGLPVYAECGGLMYLGNELVIRRPEFSHGRGAPPVVRLVQAAPGTRVHGRHRRG